MNGYPIQPAKIQSPALREQTLARDRLLDWLAAKINQRVILVLADAGYGKTTLLADFSRRTRLRTLWYRLDDDDRDWIAFVSHLVAAGREHDPGFAPTTTAMLSDLGVGMPSREAVTDVFLRELPAIAEHGAVLMLDDFHLVDESPDVRMIARELVARAPERLTIIFASRRTPGIPLARLRASGEVAELGTDDLRFDVAETARLFEETYGRALEPDVLADVAARTEGWAASLQLVQAALRDRSPAEIRRFVRSMTGADQELYDYLAEEVVGDLPDDLQQFLMRTSILQVVTPELAAVVSGLDEAEVIRLTFAAERLTLLARPSRSSRTRQRYHPLVREFLEARLLTNSGAIGVSTLHRLAAEAAAPTDWSLAAYHFRKAGDGQAVASVIQAAIPEIMGNAAYGIAAEFIGELGPDEQRSGFGVITSRLQMQHGNYEGAIETARSVLASNPVASERDHALLNLMTVHLNAGEADAASEMADALHQSTEDPNLRLIVDAVRLSIETGGYGGDLDRLATHFRKMAASQRDRHPHHFGVTMLNLALLAVLQDDPTTALAVQDEAIEALETSSASIELSSALISRAAVLAQLGRLGEADSILVEALARPELRTEPDLVLEAAEYQDSYGNPDRVEPLLMESEVFGTLNERHQWARSLIAARHHVRRRRYPEARRELDALTMRSSTNPGSGCARLVVSAHLAAAAGGKGSKAAAEEARVAATGQRAHAWRRVAQLLIAYHESDAELSSTVEALGSPYPWHLTFVSDLLVRRLGGLSPDALSTVRNAALIHPVRWRHSLRLELETPAGKSTMSAARLLELVGDKSDVRRLRLVARTLRRMAGAGELGRGLARRLAPKVFVEDLGRVSIVVGDATIAGTSVRRRVLALLTFLLCRPDFSSTRDQVLEALWPELEPALALNSLNQTVYFMRRVFQEDFDDDISPRYVNHDSELLWLDPELVSSRSALCAELIRQMPLDPSPSQVETLSRTYTGRLALDFEYEDWSQSYRDWLHASFLQIIERAVTSDLGSGHFERGIKAARHALEIDADADSVEMSLLRLYRSSGAHSAAAEQYIHYAEKVREDLGVEPPPLESL